MIIVPKITIIFYPKAIAKSKKSEFELVGVATRPGNFVTPQASGNSRLGCGFRFISDGIKIRVGANVLKFFWTRCLL